MKGECYNYDNITTVRFTPAFCHFPLVACKQQLKGVEDEEREILKVDKCGQIQQLINISALSTYTHCTPTLHLLTCEF